MDNKAVLRYSFQKIRRASLKKAECPRLKAGEGGVVPLLRNFLLIVFVFNAIAPPAFAGPGKAFPESAPSEKNQRKSSSLFQRVFGSGGGAGANQHEKPISLRALWLFHRILEADKDFTPSEKQTLEKWLKGDNGRFAARQLAELMKEMDIPISEKLLLRRILKDFYSEKSKAERLEISRRGMGHAQDYLAQEWWPKRSKSQRPDQLVEERQEEFVRAFRSFIDDVKERYAVLDLTARERRAIEEFRKLLAMRGEGAEKSKISGREVRQFRRVLENLNIPGSAQNDALVMDYLNRFLGDLEGESGSEKTESKSAGERAEARAEAQKNHYESLEIERSASKKEIKMAYRVLMQKYHPDRHQQKSPEIQKEMSEKTIDVREAYDTLSDSEKRAEYDVKLSASEAAEVIRAAVDRAEAGPSKGAANSPRSDQTAWDVLKEVKHRFDQTHYASLKEMSRLPNLIKSFLPQFILFNLAAGASIYTLKYTDPFLYGIHRNPGELSDTIEYLSDEKELGMHAAGFGIFIVTAQYTNTFFYGKGMRYDSLALRRLAPVAGLATGFILSTVFHELFEDQDFRECLFGGNSSELYHLTPCEKAYLTWLEGKWQKYAIDTGLVVGSMMFSHAIIQGLLGGIRHIPGGAAFLARMAKMAGLRLTGWFGFFSTLYLFMKSHAIADSVFGKKLKEHVAFRDIEAELINFRRFGLLGGEIGDQESLVWNIKKIGHKFSLWAAAKAEDYQAAFMFWTRKTNKIAADYESYSRFLKFLFQSSRTPYGAPFAKLKDSTMRFEEIKNTPFDFEAMKIRSYGKSLCLYLVERKDLREALSVWDRYCFENKEILKFGSPALAAAADEIPAALYVYLFENMEILGISEMPAVEAASYLGVDPDDLFSPFRQPVYGLSPEQKWRLAAGLLDGYYTPAEELSAYYSESAIGRIEKGFCGYMYPLENGKDLYENCLAVGEMALQATTLLEHKLLAGAVYLMKDIQKSDFNLPRFAAIPELQPQAFLDMASFIKVYRKGEGLFEIPLEKEWSLPPEMRSRPLAPYVFLRHLICGAAGAEAENDLFAPPSLFDDVGELRPLCAEIPVFSVQDGSYEITEEEKLAFHRILFDRPVQMGGKSHGGLWLALEDYVRKYYPKEKLLGLFEAKSEEPLSKAAEKALDNLDTLTEEYLIPELTSQESLRKGADCASILDYYDEERIFRERGFLNGLGTLEVYIFQSLFWMKRIKALKMSEEALASALPVEEREGWTSESRAEGADWPAAADSDFQAAGKGAGAEDFAQDYPQDYPQDYLLEEEEEIVKVYSAKPFDEKVYNEAVCEAAELLQSYHDSYASNIGYGPRVFFPQKDVLKEIESQMFPELTDAQIRALIKKNVRNPILADPSWSPVEALRAVYPEARRPIWTPKEFVKFSILQKSYPEMNNIGHSKAAESNMNAALKGKEAAYALFVEMSKSLDGFFRAMIALTAKEAAQDRLDLKKNGLQP